MGRCVSWETRLTGTVKSMMTMLKENLAVAIVESMEFRLTEMKRACPLSTGGRRKADVK